MQLVLADIFLYLKFTNTNTYESRLRVNIELLNSIWVMFENWICKRRE